MAGVVGKTGSSGKLEGGRVGAGAWLEGEGGLGGKAPHMPVHLGSLGDCVTAVMRKHPAMDDGDVFVTNAPYDGGTHLPDVTVIARASSEEAERKLKLAGADRVMTTYTTAGRGMAQVMGNPQIESFLHARASAC